eukprot:CAMPEP_0171106352 /NCGR_PEP_ID=MMETSP0766_2-20121228/64591_1 /TAXON_ID=439317 /ORGANISM="Gambierdiscus australes, Strain CAWD 149" /LENGTH=36 /DNA_ID= /DNA_START= /DNA_END= /DNA_ORIENTATION=
MKLRREVIRKKYGDNIKDAVRTFPGCEAAGQQHHGA